MLMVGRFRVRESLIEIAATGFCLLLVTIVSLSHYGLLHESQWLLPRRYSRVGLLVLTLLEAAASGDFQPAHSLHITNLGAPAIANWNSWPIYNPMAWKVGGYLCQTFGLVVGAHLFLLLAQIFSSFVMYLVLRIMRVRPLVASVCSAGIGLSPVLLRLGFTPVGLTSACWAPLLILAGHICFHPKPPTRVYRSSVLLMMLSFLMGGVAPVFSAPYFALIIISMSREYVKYRSFYRIIPQALCAVALMAGLMTQLRPALDFAANNGWHFLMTDSHGFPASATSNVNNQHSIHLNFGIPAVAGLVFLFAFSGYRRLIHHEPLPGWVWSSLTLLLISLIGTGAPFPCLILSAVGLSFLAVSLNCFFDGSNLKTKALVTLFLLASVVAEPLISRKAVREPESNAYRKYHSDSAFAAEMERALPSQALVYCHPAIDFRSGMTFLRPALWTQSIRYNFGHFAGQNPFDWAGAAHKQSATNMVSQLRKQGFHGILLYRKKHVIKAIRNPSKRFRREVTPMGLSSIRDDHGDFILYPISSRQTPSQAGN
jgi:hypothetical protein